MGAVRQLLCLGLHNDYRRDIIAAVQRTSIVLPEDLLKRLRRLAAERGVSMAAVIREALEEKVQSHRPRPRSLGVGASAYSDTARRTAEERPVPRSWR